MNLREALIPEMVWLTDRQLKSDLDLYFDRHHAPHPEDRQESHYKPWYPNTHFYSSEELEFNMATMRNGHFATVSDELFRVQVVRCYKYAHKFYTKCNFRFETIRIAKTQLFKVMITTTR
jgi:hypothetical protein